MSPRVNPVLSSSRAASAVLSVQATMAVPWAPQSELGERDRWPPLLQLEVTIPGAMIATRGNASHHWTDNAAPIVQVGGELEVAILGFAAGLQRSS